MIDSTNNLLIHTAFIKAFYNYLDKDIDVLKIFSLDGIVKFFHKPLFPLLFAIYPILYLYSRNTVFIPIEQITRSIVLSLLILLFLYITLKLILRDWMKAGLTSSLLVGMFFSYGHLENLLQKNFTLGLASQNQVLLRCVWLILFLVLSYLILRVKLPKDTVMFLNLCSLVLVIQPSYAIITSFVSTHPASIAHDEQTLATLRDDQKYASLIYNIEPDQRPDIYYIILDGYERPDQLQKHYQLDVSPFIQSLTDRGFFIADQARSNFLNTTYSLNTSLNLMYFEDFPPSLQKIARYNLQTNYLSDFLKLQGYQIVVFDSGTGDTNNQVYDTFISTTPVQAGETGINSFETLLVQTTIIKMLFSGGEADPNNEGLRQRIVQELKLRRDRIDSAFTHLPDYAADQQPQLLFAHIYSPHIPFLYGADGKPLEYASTDSISWYEPPPEDYIQQYGYQIEYLNTRLVAVIDQILSDTTRPAVIIVQSDHGDDHYLDWESMNTRGVDLRSSILYAVYYSDKEYADFYPTITPVNTFRNVLNHWFGTTYPLVADKVMFHEHSVTTRPNALPKFSDACKLLDVCIPSRNGEQ